LIKIDAYISLCNIDHDSSDQIVYYMIVEQESFTIGICRFLIKKGPKSYVLGDIAIQFDSEEHCWWCSCQTLQDGVDLLRSSDVHWSEKIFPGEGF